jgi:hypothetical protein
MDLFKMKQFNDKKNAEKELDGIMANLSAVGISSKGKIAVDNILDSDDDSGGMVFLDEDENAADSNGIEAWDSGSSPAFKNQKESVHSSEFLPRNRDFEKGAHNVANTSFCISPVKTIVQAPCVSQNSQLVGKKEVDKHEDEEGDLDEEDVEDKSERGSDSGSDYTDDEHEGEAGYKPGGYHPVKIGEIYNQRYVVIKKLGWGHFSTVWMVKDRKVIATGGELRNQFFALKVQKSAEHYTDAAMDEVELLDCVASERKQSEMSASLDSVDPDGVTAKEMLEYSRHVASLHDSFFHTGPNGRHMCMVFTMLGCNLLAVIKAFNYRGIPIPVVKRFVKGICMGLDFLHRKCSIIHTDLKPENVLLQFPNQIASTEDVIPQPDMTNHRNPLGMSLAELELALQDPNLHPDERRRIKIRIKKRQKKEINGILETSDDDCDDDSDSDDFTHGDPFPTNNRFSDIELEAIMSTLDDKTPVAGSLKGSSYDSHPHSAFVINNFSQEQGITDSKLSEIMHKYVKISRPSTAELDAFIRSERSGGNECAKVSFLIRAFSPEEELANAISFALGTGWDVCKDNDGSREW